MRIIKTLALAAVFAAGTTAYGFAQNAGPNSVYNFESITDATTARNPEPAQVPQALTPADVYVIQASPWISERFDPNRGRTVEQGWLFRSELDIAG